MDGQDTQTRRLPTMPSI